ncbi:Protein of unknown function DUF3468 [Penicillium brevicompactum]
MKDRPGLSDSSLQPDYAERYEMSRQVVSSLNDLSPSQAIDDLDNNECNNEDPAPFSLFRGPFGASRWSEPVQDESSVSDFEDIPSSLDGWFEQLEQIPRSDDLSHSFLPLDTMDTNVYEHMYLEELPSHDTEIYPTEPTQHPEPSLSLAGGNIEGWTLLSHYKDRIIPLISPLRRGQETPWVSLMMKGDPEERRAWLVQTEKFICVKGLSQPKLSAKKRALHHCYAYMRIMAETTCIAGTLATNAIEPGSTLYDETPSLYGGDFRIYPNQEFSATAMLIEKDPEMAQRDLHLAIPGYWSSTLFPTVYGVDEIFLMLLSQVIRLANERDLSMMSGELADARLSLKEFWTRAKALERAIDHLLSRPCYVHSQANTQHPRSTVTSTAQAMYNALLIFFHRRIYEIDSRMLQGKVDEMRRCLIEAKQEEGYHDDSNSAALIWPAFIAACEAIAPDLQSYFSTWFELCARTTALVHASVAKTIFQTIWNKRSQANGYDDACSWPDILRDGSIRFMCV